MYYRCNFFTIYSNKMLLKTRLISVAKILREVTRLFVTYMMYRCTAHSVTHVYCASCFELFMYLFFSFRIEGVSVWFVHCEFMLS